MLISFVLWFRALKLFLFSFFSPFYHEEIQQTFLNRGFWFGLARGGACSCFFNGKLTVEAVKMINWVRQLRRTFNADEILSPLTTSSPSVILKWTFPSCAWCSFSVVVAEEYVFMLFSRLLFVRIKNKLPLSLRLVKDNVDHSKIKIF